MSVTKSIFKTNSTDNIHVLNGIVYFPKNEVKGFFHIVHGMTEHMGRYEKFMTAMAENGFITFGYDNLGHGKTANDHSELGYIAEKNGWDILARDVNVFSQAVIKEYSPKDKKLPYFLMGHSMGSFITRVACEKYVTPNKLIIMGTCGKNPAAGAGLALISVIKKVKGEKYCSPLIKDLVFGRFNKRFGKSTKNDPSLWLASDEAVRKEYYNDEYCSFNFSVSAMGDLIRLIKECNRKKWYENVFDKTSFLLVSGEDDPVGNYGKGIIEVKNNLLKHNASVECILYKNARHEILNDFTYDDVIKDIIDFIEK